MKKAVFVLVVAGFAVPVLASGINITEGWDAWDSGKVPGAPWTTPASINFNTSTAGLPAFSSTSVQPHAGARALLVNNGYGAGVGKGLQQAFGLGTDEMVEAADATPLTMSYWTRAASGAARKVSDSYVELSLGDVHAPIYGTVLTEAIPVIAFSKPYNNLAQFSYFNGKQWVNSGHSQLSATPTAWDQVTMVLTSTSAALSGPNAGTVDLAREYLGGFDRVSIRTNGNAGGSWVAVDDLSITGGNIVVTPEPASLVLLGLGGLFLRRRTR